MSEYPRAKLPTPFIACHLRCTPPLVPLVQPPLCRPEHEYFAQNAVCYITHIIIGKSRQRILSPGTHTHTHTYEKLARSLMQTTPPISGQRPPTQRALMWQLQHQQQEPRPRYAHEAGHGQAALPPQPSTSFFSAKLRLCSSPLPPAPSAFGQSACGRF